MAKKVNIKDAEIVEEKEKKVKPEKSNKEDKKEPKQSFFKASATELKKVVWPKIGDVVKYTLAVIFFCIFLALFFELLELFAAFLKGLFR